MEESSEESETDSQLSIILEDTDIDLKDLQKASLDDALDTTEGKIDLNRLEVFNNFVLRGEPNFSHGNRSERSFREPYEYNWWLETEKTLPPLNNLLSIILYSDATTLDGLEKSSGHPVFLTLVKPDSLHFGIKGRVKIFAARISFFLADMLEADKITATFKLANCKMSYHTCMVLRENLNKMDFELAPSRTHENMQQKSKYLQSLYS
ncbi:hypothetical protein C1646_751202 [Rhizophagus diaphanus]|nr:hypothetical protein C1646_751202 [Rhizophagus diaphanus] [Rhizophagus sp. MUCL 43196]